MKDFQVLPLLPKLKKKKKKISGRTACLVSFWHFHSPIVSGIQRRRRVGKLLENNFIRLYEPRKL